MVGESEQLELRILRDEAAILEELGNAEVAQLECLMNQLALASLAVAVAASITLNTRHMANAIRWGVTSIGTGLS
jgi:hypothetical protein